MNHSIRGIESLRRMKKEGRGEWVVNSSIKMVYILLMTITKLSKQ